jgi:pimeloyl-ACP methyl ester carboxylesterase
MENGTPKPAVLNGCAVGLENGCSHHGEHLTLAAAQARFEREAHFGVCDTGRYRCPYYVWGTGPTLICVPGLADDARSFLLLAAQLSKSYRCVAYNWPAGEGDCDVARVRHYTHDDFVADLIALMDHLGAAHAFPLGYSFGSTVALSAMHKHPGRFPRAIFLGGFARRPLAPAEVLLASLARYWEGHVAQVPFIQWVLQAGRREAFIRREPVLWHYYLDRNGSLPLPALAQRALVLHDVDLRWILPQIEQPVLLICGDSDPLVGKQCEAELLMGLPRVARVELERCGHLSIYTHPEAVAEVAMEFLAGQGLSVGGALYLPSFSSSARP